MSTIVCMCNLRNLKIAHNSCPILRLRNYSVSHCNHLSKGKSPWKMLHIKKCHSGQSRMNAWVKHNYGWWCPVYTFSSHFTGPEIEAFFGCLTKVIKNCTMCRPKRHSWKRCFCTRSATKIVWSNCMFSVLPLESFYSVFKIWHDTMCPNHG